MTSTINASSAGIVQTADASGALALQTGGAQALYLDASQNATITGNLTVGGTITSSGGGSAITSVTAAGTTVNGIGISASTTSNAVTLALTGSLTGVPTLSGTQTWTGTQSFAAITATSYGAISATSINCAAATHTYAGFNTTANSNYAINAQSISANPSGSFYTGTTSGASGILVIGNSYASTNILAYWGLGTPSSTTLIGSVSINSSSNGVLYNTSSDRRLKQNIATLTDSGSFIDALLPRTFNWINNGLADTGFIADELQQVVPQAVTGQPNATKEDGTPIYQNIDPSTPEMIAHMVAELQSLRKRVAALEAKVGI